MVIVGYKELGPFPGRKRPKDICPYMHLFLELGLHLLIQRVLRGLVDIIRL